MIVLNIVALLAGAALTAAAATAGADPRQLWAPRGADTFDALLDNGWYLPTADKSASLYVTELGEGSPVVVLHGGAGDDFNYLVDAVRPEASHFRFVLFDQRGSVLSPVTDTAVKSITLDTLVDDLETLRLALGQERLVLLGHSFGSLLALRYYEKYPTHVAGLVLTGACDPATPDGLGGMIKAIRARQAAMSQRPGVAQVLKAEGLDGDPKAMTPAQRYARSRIEGANRDLVHVERWRRLQPLFDNSAVDDAVGDSLPPSFDFRPTLKAHPVPIDIIQGDQDYMDPGAAAWRDTSAKVRVIPGASHMAWIDNPDAFSTALREALRDAAAGD
jgi:pimeloyl-ACP methyl ester carboxylesterase